MNSVDILSTMRAATKVSLLRKTWARPRSPRMKLLKQAKMSARAISYLELIQVSKEGSVSLKPPKHLIYYSELESRQQTKWITLLLGLPVQTFRSIIVEWLQVTTVSLQAIEVPTAFRLTQWTSLNVSQTTLQGNRAVTLIKYLRALC